MLTMPNVIPQPAAEILDCKAASQSHTQKVASHSLAVIPCAGMQSYTFDTLVILSPL